MANTKEVAMLFDSSHCTGCKGCQVALVGPLVEFLGDRKEDLRAEGFVGLGIADVA